MRAIGVALLVLMATSLWVNGAGTDTDQVTVPRFHVPFDGPGQLATVWSWGDIAPSGPRALVVTARGRSRRLDVDSPRRVRWRTATELLVEEFLYPAGERPGRRVTLMAREGATLRVLADRDGLTTAEPSPDGRHAVFDRYDGRSFRGLEVRSLSAPLTLEAEHHDSRYTGSPVWSPDGSRFAVARQTTSHDEPGRSLLHPRLVVVDRNDPSYTRVPDEVRGGVPERWAVIPLFWIDDGIYVRSSLGLLRCDPDGSGCAEVYSEGEGRAIVAGTHVGKQTALLLVRDLELDPLEVRAKEIHEVDLRTGTGRVLLRLPDDVFIADIDWIADGRG